MAIRPVGDKGGIADKLITLAKHSLIYLTLFLFFIFNFLPLHVLSVDVQLNLILMTIFFWRLYNPNIMPLSLVLLIGVLTDIMISQSVGFYTVVYLGVGVFLKFQRKHLIGQPFFILWICFGLFLFALHLLLATYLGYFLGVEDVFFHKLIVLSVNLIVFPFVNMLLFFENRMITKL